MPSEGPERWELIARALCRASGCDPDDLVLIHRVPHIGPKGHVIIEKAAERGKARGHVKAFTLFYGEAHAVIAALDPPLPALGPLS